MTPEELFVFLDAGRRAQAAVDAVLSPTEQARERLPDGTFRVRCQTCAKSVSNPLPLPVIVRARVTCPECLEQER